MNRAFQCVPHACSDQKLLVWSSGWVCVTLELLVSKISLLTILHFHFTGVTWTPTDFRLVKTCLIHSFPPSPITVVHLEALRHVLGFAVGHHADDADHQQRHADAGDSQHPPLIELLSLCGLKQARTTHTFARAQTHTHTDGLQTQNGNTHTCTHAQCECYSIDGNHGNRFVTIVCFHPGRCTAALACHVDDSHIKDTAEANSDILKKIGAVNCPDINILLLLHSSHDDHGTVMLWQ